MIEATLTLCANIKNSDIGMTLDLPTYEHSLFLYVYVYHKFIVFLWISFLGNLWDVSHIWLGMESLSCLFQPLFSQLYLILQYNNYMAYVACKQLAVITTDNLTVLYTTVFTRDRSMVKVSVSTFCYRCHVFRVTCPLNIHSPEVLVLFVCTIGTTHMCTSLSPTKHQ